MEDNERSAAELLVVNRAEVVSEGCKACGQSFAWDPAGVRALSVAVGPDARIYAFCATCGEAIMNHLDADAVRERYGWDWVVALNRAPFQKRSSDAPSEKSAQPESGAAGGSGGGFRAFGKTYDSERDAIIGFLYKARVGEANGGEAFKAWSAVCTTDRLKAGIRMIAEREIYHARIFDRRLAELGGEMRWSTPEEGRKFKEYLGDPNIPDGEKLQRFAQSVGDPEQSIKPIRDFAALIREDIQTKETLLLFAEDEISSAIWACRSLASVNRSAANGMKAAAASPNRASSD